MTWKSTAQWATNVNRKWQVLAAKFEGNVFMAMDSWQSALTRASNFSIKYRNCLLTYLDSPTIGHFLFNTILHQPILKTIILGSRILDAHVIQQPKWCTSNSVKLIKMCHRGVTIHKILPRRWDNYTWSYRWKYGVNTYNTYNTIGCNSINRTQRYVCRTAIWHVLCLYKIRVLSCWVNDLKYQATFWR